MALPRTASCGGTRAVAHDRARTKIRAGPIPATKVNGRVHTSGRAEGAHGAGVRSASLLWLASLVTDLHVLRVFCGPGGRYGNQLGVVLDGHAVATGQDRQAVAARLGFSETVFVDDAGTGVVDIYTPSVRLPFAGHPLVGTSWLLGRLRARPELLHPPAGSVPTWQDGEFTWIRGRAQWAPDRRMQQYASAEEVDSLPCPPPGDGWLYAWAWQDRAAGRVRTRGFPAGGRYRRG
ncbi:PhzF family phenazine biosynthesis protein [Micromonospora sp. NPDC050200]|uniref:PhzF family phenazine biosynthesis protein n=1 Tax=Micromonospora sp. NPDC050200 TaxID=3155664 RepID=UPI0033CA7B4B